MGLHNRRKRGKKEERERQFLKKPDVTKCKLRLFHGRRREREETPECTFKENERVNKEREEGKNRHNPLSLRPARGRSTRCYIKGKKREPPAERKRESLQSKEKKKKRVKKDSSSHKKITNAGEISFITSI